MPVARCARVPGCKGACWHRDLYTVASWKVKMHCTPVLVVFNIERLTKVNSSSVVSN